MKINKIVLYNFNSFEGLNEFDFTNENPDKNIVLIGGKNGAGKTSLFMAIKIALYGPLAYGYIGVNPHYIAKIKDCINSKAFQKDVVEAGIQITISLMVEREIKEYEITRKWDYTKQKLVESYYIKMNGQRLDEQELSYFQNYLQGLIPPDLFEFFLFDGEEVGSIFSTSSYNSYVRNAIYTLCRLDIFEIIRKYTGNHIGKASDESEEKVYGQYEELRISAERLEIRKKELEAQITADKEILEQIEIDLMELETAFKNAGGITGTEREKLSEEFNEAERLKAESLTRIKMFVENLMPFYIVKDFAGRITEQLEFKEKGEIFYYVRKNLNKKDIQNVLRQKSDVDEETVDTLMKVLLDKFKPKGFKDDAKAVHDLSKEETGRVNAMISAIENFDAQSMVELVNQRKEAADRTAEINKILKSAMTDEDAGSFAERENSLLKKKEAAAKKLYEAQKQIEDIEQELNEVVLQRDKAFQKLKDNAQNKNVFELSSGIAKIMGDLLTDKMVSIKKNLEDLIVANLQHIYRKNNLITHIEIEDDFQFNLYQNAKYTATELLYLLRNLGKDVFASEIGKQGQQSLFALYGVNNLSQLQQKLSLQGEGQTVETYKKIDLSRLSKGERQIFILSLYWAVIKLSGQEIPFVIDTPYARIDANHRKEISEKFFPNISRQVIILSTDEEIDEEYYEIIKPHVAKEFLLINDEGQNRTSIEQHYFFEV